MKNFNYIVCLILIIITGCEQQQEAKVVNPYQDMIDRVDSVAIGFINKGEVTGISIAIRSKNDTLYNKGFGFEDLEKTDSINNQNIFLLASISKLIGSTLIMKLVEERKISLEQSLQELLPDFPNPEVGRKVTLIQMISHTSGLQDYASVIDSAYVNTGIAPTKEDFFNFFKDRPLLFEPGSNYSYCNSGFLLMAMIVERLTGNSFSSEIDRVINQPTGMHLKLIADQVDNKNMTSYFEYNGSTFNPIPHWTWIKGDGGLTTTSLELASFPFFWSSGQIISQDSYQFMTTPTRLSDGVMTGYGLGVRNGLFIGEKIIGHTGGNKSVKSIMVYFPQRELSIVVMVNTDNTRSHARAIFGQVALAFIGIESPDYSKNEVTENDLEKFEGTFGYKGYKFDDTVSVALNKEDGHLYYSWGTKGESVKLINLGNGEFWVKSWPFDRLIFDLDEQGNVRALKEYYGGFYVLLRRRI